MLRTVPGPRRRPAGDDGPTAPDREASLRAVIDTVAGSSVPSPRHCGCLPIRWQACSSANCCPGPPRPLVGPVLPAAPLVDLFLHGALAGAEAA